MLPTGSLIATPTTLGLHGSNVKLSWTSSYALTGILDNGIGAVANPATGSVTVFAMYPTTYTMTFQNTEGQFVSLVMVTVSSDPVTSLSGGKLQVTVARELGGGVTRVNLSRPTSDGTPSYVVRSFNQ